MVYRTLDYKDSSNAIYLPILGGVSIHWTGLPDWNTGLTFDPKILTRNVHFMLIGSPSCPFSGQEDNYSYIC